MAVMENMLMENVQSWLQARGGPVAIVLAAVVAWCYHRRLAAKKGALDFLLKNEIDNREWRETRRKVREILDKRLPNVLCPQSQGDWDDRHVVGTLLSRYEFIAIAIRYKTMDEAIYRQWNGRAYVRMWSRAEKYILARRAAAGDRGSSRYFHFEKLAKKWGKDQLS